MPLDIISSTERTLSVRFSEQIMSADTYPSIFSRANWRLLFIYSLWKWPGTFTRVSRTLHCQIVILFLLWLVGFLTVRYSSFMVLCPSVCFAVTTAPLEEFSANKMWLFLTKYEPPLSKENKLRDDLLENGQSYDKKKKKNHREYQGSWVKVRSRFSVATKERFNSVLDNYESTVAKLATKLWRQILTLLRSGFEVFYCEVVTNLQKNLCCKRSLI